MWTFDSIYGKAKIYFARGAEHEHSDDDEFVIWHLLGFEFLLRAPLARVHPSLLAAPEGDSILAANGVPTKSDPKSIPSHTVVSRLTQLVPDYTKDRQDDSLLLLNLRNAELHSGANAVANVPNEVWLPKLIRVAEVICSYLDVGLDDLLDEEVVELGTKLVDQEDKKLAHEVQVKIQVAREFVARLQPEEVEGRVPPKQPAWMFDTTPVSCPACGQSVPVVTDRVRASGQRFEDDMLVRDVVYVATSFNCPVCTLTLPSTAEISAAGLQQQFTVPEYEDLSERFAEDAIDDGYGND